MSLARVKVWIAGEVLTASELNAEFNNILNNPVSLISPLTATLDLDGQRLTLDSDGDLNLLTTSDDVLALRKDTTSLFVWDAATASVVNGLQFLSTIANDAVEIQAQGTDAQIHVRLVPKGAQGTVSSSGGWAVEGTTEAEWRIDASAGDFLLQENTGSVASPTWTTRWTLAAGASVCTAVLVNTGTSDSNVPTNTQLKGTARVYTKCQQHAITTLTDEATITWTAVDAPNAMVTITADRAISLTTAGLANGAFISLIVKQDGSGGHAITNMAALALWPDAITPSVYDGAGERTLIQIYVADGTVIGVIQGPYT